MRMMLELVLKLFFGVSAHGREDVRGASRQCGLATAVMRYRRLRNGVLLR